MTAGKLETLEALLSAARSPDDAAPRAEYCAAARVAYDSCAARMKDALVTLTALEAHLLGKSALLEEPKE